MAGEEDNARAEDLVKVGLEHLRKSGAWNPAKFGLTDTTQSDVATRHRRDDQAVTDFDRMSHAERAELARTNPEEFQRVLKAKEEAGYRDLMKGPGNQRY